MKEEISVTSQANVSGYHLFWLKLEPRLMDYFEFTWALFVEGLLQRNWGYSDSLREAFTVVVLEVATIAAGVVHRRNRRGVE